MVLYCAAGEFKLRMGSRGERVTAGGRQAAAVNRPAACRRRRPGIARWTAANAPIVWPGRAATAEGSRRTAGCGRRGSRVGASARHRHDVLAYFDHHASNGPTEAINGRLEALRRNALGFRNLTHYRLRSLLHCGNLVQQIDAL
jgi:transposase